MSELERRVRAAAAWLRTATAARWAFRAALAATVVVFAIIGRHQWFTRDDWASVITRPDRRATVGLADFLFAPQDGHWMTIPVLLYDTTRHLFGLDSYWPFLIPAMVAHIAAVLLARVLCLRHHVSPWTTTLLCSTLLMFGPGWENIVFAIQITYNFSLVAFLAQVVLTDHDGPADRRDWIGSGLALIGVMSSGFGPIFIVGIAVVLVLRQRWKALLIAVVPQGLAYAWWALVWATDPASDNHPGNKSQIPQFAAHGLRATFDALTGLPGLGVIALFATLAVVLCGRFGRRSQAMFIGLGTTVVFMFVAIGFERVGFGVQLAESSRYIHIAAIVIAPAFGLAVDQLARIAREARWAGLGLLGLAITLNFSTLRQATNSWALSSADERDTFELIAGSGLAAQADPARFLFADSPDVTVGSLASMVKQGALRARLPANDREWQRVRVALGLPAP